MLCYNFRGQLVHRGFIYSCHSRSVAKCVAFWRCAMYKKLKCPAALTTRKKEIASDRGVHNHEAPKPLKIFAPRIYQNWWCPCNMLLSKFIRNKSFNIFLCILCSYQIEESHKLLQGNYSLLYFLILDQLLLPCTRPVNKFGILRLLNKKTQNCRIK